jgi:hypothetical protein
LSSLFVMEPEQTGCTMQLEEGTNRQREESRTKAKPFCISQREMWETYKRVKRSLTRIVKHLLTVLGIPW